MPWKPGCIAAASGIVHLVLSHGSLVEVCGGEVRTLFERELEDGGPNTIVPLTEALYGVVAAGDALVVAGTRGLYRVTDQGAGRQPLPAFRDVGGIQVSFQLPGLALVRTRVNQRMSVGGSVPLLVSRP